LSKTHEMLTLEELSKEIEAEQLTNKKARVDIRLKPTYKMFLKQVYKSAGYSSLSAFILDAAIEKAEGIIEKEKAILASEQDKEIFFNALLETAEPNEALLKATKEFQEAID